VKVNKLKKTVIFDSLFFYPDFTLSLHWNKHCFKNSIAAAS